jgi:hypothetical protein
LQPVAGQPAQRRVFQGRRLARHSGNSTSVMIGKAISSTTRIRSEATK